MNRQLKLSLETRLLQTTTTKPLNALLSCRNLALRPKGFAICSTPPSSKLGKHYSLDSQQPCLVKGSYRALCHDFLFEEVLSSEMNCQPPCVLLLQISGSYLIY